MLDMLMVFWPIFVLVGLVCFVLIVIKMFRHGSAGLGILSIALSCIGVGQLIAFIMGMKKGKEWGTSMIAIIGLVSILIGVGLFYQDAQAKKRRSEEQQIENNMPKGETLEAPEVDIPFD
ncbi:MAG: uncharacterized membrane protein YebE (DUF533 family) [Pirellulaceae bacterium]|jgi:uncharacterized membrane protein YebE (DUF533 family)